MTFPRRNKFSNNRCIVTPALGIFTDADMTRAGIGRTKSDVSFPSKREAKRYVYLKQLEQAGEIRNLECQRPFPLVTQTPDGHAAVVSTYRADFVYERIAGDQWESIVEDSKGFPTDIYKLKKKWVKLQYGVEIQEV